jgi:glycosyltransferase involved in cell wall biosynthesis
MKNRAVDDARGVLCPDVHSTDEGTEYLGASIPLKWGESVVNILAYVHLRNIVNSTGAGRVARHLVENLVLLPGIHIDILADAGDHKKVIGQLGRPWTKLRYHLFETDTSVQQARWALTGTPRAERYWPEADVVYCTAESYVPTRSKRLVVTVHDAAIFEEEAHEPGYVLFKQRLKWRVLYSILARRADLLHTVSHYSAERLGHYFPAIRSRLRVVHNAAPERFFGPVSQKGEEFLEKTALKERPYILVPGGLQYRKNAESVLNSVTLLKSRLPNYRLVVAGHCEPRYAHRASTLGENILLTGFVDDEALCSLYQRATVVWFPSKYEGFGVPVLEAMACGVPVVTSNCTALPEIAGKAAILVSPNDLYGNLEAIETVCRDGALRDELILRGRTRARQFAWRTSAAKLLSHIRSIN